MDPKNNIFTKIKQWLVAKWKWIVGIFSGLLILGFSLLRISNRDKENVENLKDTHAKEKEIIEKSHEKLTDETDKIRASEDVKRTELVEKFKEREKELQAKKDALAREARDSETLAKDLADKLGVDFVETTKDDD